MGMPKIHVHTASDKSTIPYTKFMWESMRSLASRPEALRLTVHAIGPTAAGAFEGLPNAQGIQVQMRKDGDGGSMAHATCVEHALAYTGDGSIHIICDSDTVVMARGWDDLLRTKLIDERVGIVGVSYEDIGGFSSGASTSQTYKGIPNATWMALSPLYSWKGLKAVPEKAANLPISNDQQSKIYNLPVGYSVLRDVAWQIPQFLFDHRIPYQAWKQLKGSGPDALIIKGLEDYHEEFHCTPGLPFVVHQRGSLRHAYRGAKMSQRFYEAVDHYLSQETKFDPRWIWEANEKNNTDLVDIEAARVHALETQPEPAPILEPPSVKATEGNGWFKGSLDGLALWPRQRTFKGLANMDFKPGNNIHNLRLEGTCSELELSLPRAEERPYTCIVRNMIYGPTVLRTGVGATLTVPQNVCWMVVVDVDGVYHAQ